MEIIFIRHAERDNSEKDPSLTKKGERQARYLAKRIKNMKINEIYSSNLKRAKLTAEFISRATKIKIKIENSLDEFESETIKKPKRKWNEKEKEHYKRLISFLKNLTKNPNEKRRVVIVAHGVTNRIILSYFLKLNLRRMITFMQDEGCINIIYWKEKFQNWRLKCWNDISYISKI